MSKNLAIRTVGLSKKFHRHSAQTLKQRLLSGRSTPASSFWALQDINLSIDAGHTVGLIGRNGSGKSTLLKNIAGVETPTTGYVERRGRLAGLLELGAGFHPDLSGRENIFLNASILGLSNAETHRHFDEIVDFSGIEDFIDQPVRTYSSGMYVRLAFAVAVHINPDILLIDEVLSVGDADFQAKCSDRIERILEAGTTVVLVTHSLDRVKAMCDRAVYLDRGRVIVDGTPDEAIAAYLGDGTPPQAGRIDDCPASLVRIDSVVVRGRDHRERSVFAVTEPPIIEIRLALTPPLNDWNASVAINTTSGIRIAAAPFSRTELNISPKATSASIVLSIPEVPLATDQYTVTVGVHARGEPQDRWGPHAIWIDNPVPGFGVLALTPQIAVSQTE